MNEYRLLFRSTHCKHTVRVIARLAIEQRYHDRNYHTLTILTIIHTNMSAMELGNQPGNMQAHAQVRLVLLLLGSHRDHRFEQPVLHLLRQVRAGIGYLDDGVVSECTGDDRDGLIWV